MAAIESAIMYESYAIPKEVLRPNEEPMIVGS
jgi:hypothetical protein